MPESYYLAANGLRLHCLDWGGSGRPIVLLHGLASNARIFGLVGPLLAQHHRVIAIDQRGHGLSDRPDDGYDGFDDVVADARAALDALAFDSPVLLGHSWGANVAAKFAASHGERLGGVIMLDGGSFALSASMSWEQAERTMAPPRTTGMPREKFLEAVRSGDYGAIWSPAVEESVLGCFDLRDDDTIAPRLTFERHMRILRSIYDYHPSEVLPAIACPTLLLPTIREGDEAWAERKKAAVDEAVRLLARGRAHWLEDTIHDAPLQRPEVVARTIREFVAEVDAPAK
jgi:pimeloyl-ACP methyl ester carboxylesterase